MSRSSVFSDALALSEKERLELAAELLASADPPTGVLVEGTPQLRTELAQRIASVKSGKADRVPWEHAKKELLEAVNEVRRSKSRRAAKLVPRSPR